MKRLTTLASILLMLCLTLGLYGATTVASAEEPADTYSAKTYTPDKYDFINYWGGVGDINVEDGDGITTFAHAAMLVPMQGSAIEMNTLFKLLSWQSVANGGNGVDAWASYSFSATPGVEGKDNSYPYGGSNGVNGYYWHVNNCSSATVPNCSEWALFKVEDGACNEVPGSRFFLDNGINVRIKFAMIEQADGTYTVTIDKLEDGANLKTVTGLALNKALFVNELGQTFFSTAIYEGAGCDGNHWEHREVCVYSFKAYTKDAMAAEVTLSEESYEFEEGTTYKPEVTVAINGTALTAEEDYYVEYTDNKAVGTASVYVYFIGDYAGNETVVKTFVIEEASAPNESTTDEPSSVPNGSTTEEPSNTTANSGCTAGMGIASFALSFAALASAVVIKRRKN